MRSTPNFLATIARRGPRWRRSSTTGACVWRSTVSPTSRASSGARRPYPGPSIPEPVSEPPQRRRQQQRRSGAAPRLRRTQSPGGQRHQHRGLGAGGPGLVRNGKRSQRQPVKQSQDRDHQPAHFTVGQQKQLDRQVGNRKGHRGVKKTGGKGERDSRAQRPGEPFAPQEYHGERR